MNRAAVISASVLVVAAQAMSAAAKESPVTIELPMSVVQSHGADAFSRPDVKVALNRAFPAVVAGFTVDGETIGDRYHVAQNQDFTSGGNTFWDEGKAADDQIRCHSACHSAGGGYC